MPFSVASTLEKHMRKCVAGGKKPGLPPPHWAAGDEDGGVHDEEDGVDDDHVTMTKIIMLFAAPNMFLGMMILIMMEVIM